MPPRELHSGNDGDWNEYRLLILRGLEQVNQTMADHSEKDEVAFEQIRQSVSQLRIDMLNGFAALQHSIESSYTKQYDILEERVRDSERKIASARGWSAGIAGTVSFVVAVLGVVATFLMLKT